MTNKLNVLILDDKKKGEWDSIINSETLSSYINCKTFDQLESAMNFLHDNHKQLHIIISDFRLEGDKGRIRKLADTAFKRDESMAQGASVTLFAEYLKNKDGCTIMINKLYTVSKVFLKEYSIESHLLSMAYIDSELLKPIEGNEITSNEMESLLMKSIQDIQRLFFRESADGVGIKNELHGARELAASILHGENADDRSRLMELLKVVLGRVMRIELRRSQVSLPLSAMFPKLNYEYDRYCKYFDKLWVEPVKEMFQSLLDEIDYALNLSRDDTEEFARFLEKYGLIGFLHGHTHKLDDGTGHFKNDILQEVEKEPYRSIFGLKEILLCFSKCYGEINSELYRRFFEKGISRNLCEDCKDILSGKELKNLFLGFKVGADIVEEFKKYLTDIPGHNLTIELGVSSFVWETADGEGKKLRLFTDKNRLLNAVYDILIEVNDRAYIDRDDKKVRLSFFYDKDIGYAKLVIEDFGKGMSEDLVDSLSGHASGTGGWEEAIALLREWVEDVWVISKTVAFEEGRAVDSIHKRSILRKKPDRINETIDDDSGTKCVILFNVIKPRGEDASSHS